VTNFIGVDASSGFRDAFAATVAGNPDGVAVASARARVTYAELDRWSDGIAAALAAAVGPGADPVMILAENDEWCVAAFVAAAKLGRPSALLDSTTPTSRMQTICDVAAPAATLFAPDLAAQATDLGSVAGSAVVMPEPSDRTSTFDGPATEGEPLTIVFTSGSTGRPKGVMIGSVAFTQATFDWDAMGAEGERIGCPIPLSFAFGQQAMVRALITGSELHVYDPRRRGIAGITEWINANRITVLAMTPHMVRSMVASSVKSGTVLDSLRCVTTGGESVLASDIEALRSCTSDECVLYSQLGSSEAWVIARLPIDRHHPLPPSGAVSVGFAAPGREILLLDETGQPIIEPGKPGVVTIVARHLASGYWKDPDSSSARFAELDDGRRSYNSGDLGRWNELGELEYIGRSDNLLKVRGYLVEPAEVESQIRAEGEVQDCVVVGRPSERSEGDVRLIAYVVPDPAVWLSGAAVRRRLIKALPSYMVPAQFIELTELPRNPNGKLDRLSLPAPALERAERTEAWGYQEVVVRLCAAALGLHRIDLQDDIFALGADSLAVEEIAAGLEAELGTPVSSATVLENPTPLELSRLQRDSVRSIPDGVLVTLAKGGDGLPLFMIAGAGGLALQFREVAREIGGDRPIHGLQSFGLEGEGLPDFSVRQMARRLVRTIRRIQPAGPYAVAGYSIGSVVAYEVARRLMSAGERVVYLGLLDPPSRRDIDNPPLLRNFRDAPADEPTEGLPRTLAEVRSFQQLRAWAYFRHPQLTRTHWRSVRKYWGSALGGDRFRAWYGIGGFAVRRYRRPQGGLDGVTAMIYRTEENEPALLEPGWFTSAPTVLSVEGDHLTMMWRPFVTGLGALIREHVASAEKDAGLAPSGRPFLRGD
jgi:acyl-coenzyme A synthetase/AMP-(fatty) acid ligase/thioesterase domain-containing protein